MTAETIDHTTLSQLVEARAVRSVHVVGQPGGWSVLVKYGMAERALAAQRSRKVRVFRRMEALVSYLKDIGIQRFDVEAAGYEALCRAHEAATHNRWFRAQVEIALKEADDPNTVWTSNEDAKKEWAKKRAELAAQIAAGDKA